MLACEAGGNRIASRMQTRRALIATGGALAAGAARAQLAPPLAVLESFSILQDLAARIGGDAAQVGTLGPRGTDPATFQLQPADRDALRRAKVVVRNGLGYEPWLPEQEESGVASAGIEPIVRPGIGPDPHVWLDPKLGQRMAQTVAAGLGRADPAHAELYRRRAADYVAELAQEDAAAERSFAAIPAIRRKMLTTSDGFAYFGARYDVTVLVARGPDAAAPMLAAQARAERLGTVFVDDPPLAQAVTAQGVRVGPTLYVDSLSPGRGPAPTYRDLLRANAAALAASMTGT